MSSPSRSTDLKSDLESADRLKRELSSFAATGPLQKEFERQQNIFFESSDSADATEQESLLDWFLFEWFDETGQGVIDRFVEADSTHNDRERVILEDWKDSINSVFEIISLGKNSLTLRELDTNDVFLVTTRTLLDQTPFEREQCIGARLLPLRDRFIFSGIQCIMPDRVAAEDALEIRRKLEALSSPEALESAQREQCSAFCEFFKSDEITVAPGELASTLGRFQNYLFRERRNPETGATRIEEFESQFGQELQIPEMPPLPPELLLSGDVTILCDEFDGLVLLPDYKAFNSVFQTDEPETQIPGWQDLVWRYIREPEIPIVAFERVAERYPARVEKVFRQLLAKKNFSLEHMYAVLLHYKEPVEGMEDLSDDQRLWDFFDGSHAKKAAIPEPAGRKRATKTKSTDTSSRSKTTAQAGKTVAKSVAKKGIARKTLARNTTAKKSLAKPAVSRRTSSKKSAAKKSLLKPAVTRTSSKKIVAGKKVVAKKTIRAKNATKRTAVKASAAPKRKRAATSKARPTGGTSSAKKR